jgi:hypothetical protein
VIGLAAAMTAAVLGLGAIQSGSGAATPVWSIAAAANPPAPPAARLSAVACPTASECLAVGELTFFSGIAALRSDNGSWTSVPAQTPTRDTPQFFDMSCATSTACFAVGQTGQPSDAIHPLLEKWDGSRWRIVTPPKPAVARQARLTGVSCRGPSFCMAIGTYGMGKYFLDTPYSARWNGTHWSIIPTKKPEPHATFSLTNVSCWSPSGCFAVGNDSTSFDGVVTFTERWDGTTWSIVPSASPPEIAGKSNDNKLVDVSCPTSKFCFAVGYYLTSDELAVYQRPYALQWDGTSWRLLRISLGPRQSRQAVSVSCANASMCLAVGGSWITRWNGSTWRQAASPPFGGFSDVTCRAATRCVAVGSFTTPRQEQLALTARFNGTSWVADQPPSGGSQSYFWDVSCAQTDFCFAVGERSNRSSSALTERWNGAQWSIVEPVNPSGKKESELRGVSCSSTTSCVAIGDYQPAFHPFAEQWNGSSWSIIAAPPGLASGLSCPSSTLCVATGSDTWLWNGTTWTVSDPSGGAAVSCASATSCTTVGQSGSPLVARHWNGTTWSSHTLATPPGSSPTLRDVSCPAPNACTAVGNSSFVSPTTDRSFVEQWNGTSWSIASKPAATGSYPMLESVSCATPTACAAVGSVSGATLIMQWDGVAWTIAASPSWPGAKSQGVPSVSCPSAVSCFAAGSARTDRYEFPLILQYS